jgi:acetyl-CoA acyltransferase
MGQFIAGISMTRFGPQPDRSFKDLVHEACCDALADAGARTSDIETVFFSTALQGPIEGQGVPGQIALRGAGLGGIPVINVENACASGATAFWLACRHLQAGAADIVLVVGAEKMAYPDDKRRARVMASFAGGLDQEDAAATFANLAALGEGVSGTDGQGARSAFMDIYAMICRAHMARFGTTQRQLALIASKNHDHAADNERCHYRSRISVDEVLSARPLAYPLTVPMCSPLSDGASALVLCTEDGLRRLNASHARVRVLSSELRSAGVREWADFDQHVVRRAALAAYAKAGVGPNDINVAEVHDAASFGELLMSELLGFCGAGEGGPFAESGATWLGGKLPINPSGGLESKGHPIGASGLAQLFELTTQLRGNAGSRQVGNARTAIQENGGGLLGVEEAAAVVSILQRD